MKTIVVMLLFIMAFTNGQVNESRDPRAIIEKVRIYRLTKELDLTTEQAIEFFPKLNELHKIDNEFREQRHKILIQLKELLSGDAADEDIMRSLSAYENILKDRVERQIKKMREIRTMLTPSQQAKYLIFQDEFEREIREMIKEVKKLQPR
ncbi:MAG: hypothetical protein JSV53_06090 [candidate division WOR-3 bacterium]|nr:MAG: hypothetical protein JSV53_06090 [candidate division WOR-3 bacterium]